MSWEGGKLSNPLTGAVKTGGKLRSRQTINVRSKSAEVTTGDPAAEIYNSEIIIQQ